MSSVDDQPTVPYARSGAGPSIGSPPLVSTAPSLPPQMASTTDPTVSLSSTTGGPKPNTGASELSRMHGQESSLPHFGRASFHEESMSPTDENGKKSSVVVRVVKNSESKAAEAQQKQKELKVERDKLGHSTSTTAANSMPRDTLSSESVIVGGASPGKGVPAALPTPLLPPDTDEVWAHGRKIYGSFFFAAWGSRMWEFAAILFIMEGLFPDSLLASSLFGLFEALSGLCGSGLAGHILDTKDRLNAIRLAIMVQNASIVVAMVLLTICLLLGGHELPLGVRIGFLICVIGFGVTAKFGQMLDKLCVNKDWLVVVAAGNRGVQSHLNAVTRRVDMICQVCAPLIVGISSAVMGSAPTCILVGAWALLSTPIELKLSGIVYHSVPALSVSRNIVSAGLSSFPIVPQISVSIDEQDSTTTKSTSPQRDFSTIVSSNTKPQHTPRADNEDGSRETHVIISDNRHNNSTSAANSAQKQMNETVTTVNQNTSNAELANTVGNPQAFHSPITNSSTTSVNNSMTHRFDVNIDEGNTTIGGCGALVRKINAYIKRTIKDWSIYRAHPCFWISIPYALLYISVLSFGGIMVSYLKTLGCSDYILALGRGLSALVAVIPTFIVPYLIPRKGLYRTGEFMMFAQVLCLFPLIVAFVSGLGNPVTQTTNVITVNATSGIASTETTTTKSTPILFIVILFFSICASRFGLWGFDLSQTQMMQELVHKTETGRVNGSQELVINACWLMSFVLTIIFHNPESFKWPALISFGSITLATLLYTFVGMKTTAIMREQAAATLDYA